SIPGIVRRELGRHRELGPLAANSVAVSVQLVDIVTDDLDFACVHGSVLGTSGTVDVLDHRHTRRVGGVTCPRAELRKLAVLFKISGHPRTDVFIGEEVGLQQDQEPFLPFSGFVGLQPRSTRSAWYC
ncbi:MAG TPA: hypothetical protein VIL36_23200, partial [Acidimicrobiales bacterium]